MAGYARRARLGPSRGRARCSPTPAARPRRRRAAPDRPATPPSCRRRRIGVETLAPPTLAALGLAAAEAELGGPLWARGCAARARRCCCSRLPTDVARSDLARAAAALLTAPGPHERGAARAAPGLRVDRLLAMAEPTPPLELLALVPDGRQGPRSRRAGCWRASPPTRSSPPAPRPRRRRRPPGLGRQARIVCAALAPRSRPPSSSGSTCSRRAASRPIRVCRAAARRGRRRGARGAAAPPVPDDPLLLPLLRRAPLDLDPANVADAAAAGPARARRQSGPAVGRARRGRRPAAARALGAARAQRHACPPTGPRRWPRCRPSARAAGRRWPTGSASRCRSRSGPSSTGRRRPTPRRRRTSALWRGFEVARVGSSAAPMLLYVLLLLDGRPEAAAPITLRRALDALVGLDLRAGRAWRWRPAPAGRLGL